MTLALAVLPILKGYLDETLTFTDLVELTVAAAGGKSVVRLTGCPERLRILEAIASGLRFRSAIVPVHFKLAYGNGLDDYFLKKVPGYPGPGHLGIILAGSGEGVRLALELELGPCRGDEAAAVYGYPECCGLRYEETTQHGVPWIENYVSDVAAAGGTVSVPWESNRIGRLFPPYLSVLPDYFPCSVLCEATHALAKKFVAILEEAGLGNLVELAKEHLARPVLVSGGSIFWLEGSEAQETAGLRVKDSLRYAEGSGILYDPAENSLEEPQPRICGGAPAVLFFKR